MRVASLAFLCLVLASGHGAPYFKSGVHSDLCAWGSQYWCSSTKTAERCGKTEFCTTRVWPLKTIQDTQCQVTQQVIKASRQLLDSRVYKMSSFHEMAMVIAKACGSFEDDESRLQCKAIVTDKDMLPKLLKLIASRLPTESVALAVGGCRRQEALPKEKCHTCEEFTRSIQNYVSKSLSKDAYLRLFKPACDKLGQGAKLCMYGISSKYQAFLHGISEAQPNQVCEGKSVCLKKTMLSDTENLDSCSACKDVVQALRDLDRNQEVQGVVENLMKSACTYMGAFKELCDLLADEGLTYVFEAIASELEPIVVCEKLELCTGQHKNEISAPVIVKKEEGLSDCTICKSVVTAIEAFITSKSTSEEIDKLLKLHCSRQPPSLYQECSHFIDQFGPMIIRLLVSSVPPKKVCRFIKVCQDNGKIRETLQDAPNCALCEFVIKEIDTLIGSNKTEQALEQALDNVCKILPGTITAACEGLVTQYSPLIITLIVNKLDPKLVCSAIGLCKNNTVKIKEILQDAPTCALCEFVLKEIDTLIGSNKTEQALEQALDNVCKILPGTITAACEGLVTQYSPLIITLIVNKLDPKLVCSAVGLCKNNTVKIKETRQEAPTCALCEFVIKEIDTLIGSNKTEQALEQALDNVCKQLPGTITAACESLVTQYSPLIITLIVNKLDPKLVCSAVGLCKNNTVKIKESLQEAPTCALCEFVIKEIDTLIGSNKTEQALEQALDNVCKQLPGTITAACESLVTQYSPLIITLIVNKLDPKLVCSAVGLCKNNTAKIKKPLQDAPGCAVCEFVIKELDTLVGSNKTEQALEQALDNVCKQLPGTITAACESLVTQYSPLIITLIVNKLDPKLVCSTLGLCKNNTVVMTKPKAILFAKKSKTCELCEFIMNKVESILQDNSTEREIEAALDSVCQLLPSTIMEECSDWVKKYIPYVIQILIEEFQPQQVCVVLGFCSSISAKSKVISTPSVGKQKTEVCAICITVMQYAEKYLDQSSTEAEIESLLDKVCSILPESDQAFCVTMVPMLVKNVVQMFEQRVAPEDICKAIKLCSHDMVNTSQIRKKLSVVKTVKQGENCVLCKFVLGELDKLLEENATKEDITAALEEVCDLLPTQIKAQCTPFVEQYAPYVIDLLVQHLDPSQICTQLNLCNNTVISTSSVGKQKTEICAICITVMQYAEKYLDQSSTEAEIESLLDKVCSILPESDQAFCITMVPMLVKNVVQMFEQRVAPEDICKAIKLCSHDMVNTQNPLKKLSASVQMKSGELCPLCMYVFTALDNFLEKNSTEEAVIEVLDKICGVFPQEIKDQCITFVQTYAPEAVDLIVEGLSPSQVCDKIGFCSDKGSLINNLESPGSIKDSGLCDFCEEVFTTLDNLLGENSTQEQIESALERVCGIIPSSLKQECTNLIETFTPQIIQLLLQRIQPKQMCVSLGFCSSIEGKVQLLKLPKAAPGQFCTICEFVMSEVDSILKENATQQEIEEVLEKVCDLLPATVRAECTVFIQQYFPTVVKLLESISPKEICTSLGLCQGKVQLLKLPKAAPGQFCTICEFVMSEVDSILKENATQQEIEEVLEKVCDVLPATVRAECTAFIQQYFPTVVKLLESISPKEICTFLGLCQGKGKVSLIKLPKATSGELCSVCEFALNYVDQILKDKSTQAEIKQALEEVCNVLPSSLTTECTSLVDQYFQLVIQLFEELSPQEICTTLGLCQSKGTVPLLKLPKATSGELCSICEFALNYVDQILKDKSTQAEIKQALEGVCNVLPSSLKTECTSLIEQYFPLVIQFFEELSPQEICTTLGLCQSKGKVPSFKLPKATSGELCSVCEFALNYVDQILKDKSTQAEIKQALEGVCNVLPSSLKTECTSLIEQYFPLVIQFFEELSPQEICTTLGLCQSKGKVPSFKLPKATSGELCSVCEFALNYVDQILKDKSTQAEIKQALEGVCNVLPSSLKTECTSLIEQYFPLVIQFFEELSPQEICTTLGLCQSKGKVPSFKLPKATSGELCSVCEFALNYVDQILKDKSTQAEIKQALEGVCNVLPSSLKTECTSLIEQYFPLVIQFFEELSPQEICTTLGLCQSKGKVPSLNLPKATSGELCSICEFTLTYVDEILKDKSIQTEIKQALEEVCNVLPSSLTTECTSLVDQYFQLVIQLFEELSPQEICTTLGLCQSKVQERTKVKGVECVMCEFVLGKLESMVTSNSTESKIAGAIESVCSLLPSTIKNDCDDFIEKYGQLILKFLIQEVRPRQVCIAMGLCSGETILENQRRVHAVSRKNNLKSGELCTICEAVMTELDNILSSPTTEAQVKEALEKVCSFLPKSIQQECTDFVNVYADYIIDLIIQEASPKAVCDLLRLCQNTNRQDSPVLGKKINFPKAGPLCPLCEYVIDTLDKMLEQNSTQAEIEAALDKVCSYLPSTLSADCVKFVDMNAPQIIDVLVANLNPKVVCTFLRLCTNTAVAEVKNVLVEPKTVSSSSVSCYLCELVIGKVKSMIGTQTSEAEIEAALEKVCSYLPSEYKEECDDFVEKYTPMIVQLILNDVSAEQICAELGLCSSSKDVKNVLVEPKTVSSSSVSCYLCELVIGKVKSMIGTQTSEAEIEAALEKVCSYLPSEYKEECDGFVEEYTPMIVQMILNNLSAEQICAELGLCSSSKDVKNVLAESKTVDASSPSCFLCELVIGKVKNMIGTQTSEAEIEAALEKVCSYLPSEYKEECDGFVEKYTPMIVQMILNNLSAEQICAELGLCSSSKENKVALNSVEECTLCKFILEEVQGVLWSAVNEEVATNALKQVCQQLPNDLQTACTDLVIMITPNLMDFIGHRIYPKGICQFLEVCTKDFPPNSLKVFPKQESVVTAPASYSAKNCTACKFALYEVQTALATPFWQAETKTVLLLFCQKLTSSSDVCKFLVEKNLPGLISQIRGFRFPIEFCEELNMCQPELIVKRSNSLTFVSEHQQEMMTTPSPQLVKNCTACKFAWYAYQMALKSPFWQKETLTVLLHLCQKAQTSPDTCQQIVTQNLPTILDDIQGFNFPMDFCHEMNACAAPYQESKSIKSSASDTECEVCKVLAEIAGSFLQKNSTVAEAETLFTKVCNTVVPEAQRSQCISMVQEFTPVLLQLVAQFMDPQKVCETIELCPKVPGYDVVKLLRHRGY